MLKSEGHKITEPSAQIPTIRVYQGSMVFLNPQRHKITEPSAQIPTVVL